MSPSPILSRLYRLYAEKNAASELKNSRGNYRMMPHHLLIISHPIFCFSGFLYGKARLLQLFILKSRGSTRNISDGLTLYWYT